MVRTGFYKVLVAVAASWLLLAPAEARSTITVDTRKDELNRDGDCSLREAIRAANRDARSDGCRAGSGEDTIVFGQRGKITLGSMLPEITDPEGLTIDGRNKDITISGDNKVRVFRLTNGASLALRNLTVADGFRSPNLGSGSGIQNFGTLTVENSTFSGNRAGDDGGAISNLGELTVEDSTFSRNSSVVGDTGTDNGGAIDNFDGTVAVKGSIFSENRASDGGGIHNGGTLTVEDSTFSRNRASGIGGGVFTAFGSTTVEDSTFSENTARSSAGGIYNNDTLAVKGSTFSENSAPGGGGILNFNGTLLVEGSTFSSNSAARVGGGILSNGGFSASKVTNSTFSGNSATRRGGGIYVTTGPLAFETSTFSGNSAGEEGGGIFNNDGEPSLRATIVADSPQGGNCEGSVSDEGYNIDDGTSCNFSSANNSKPNTDPGLDPNGLQDNGGSTKTIALQQGSPAIDAIAQDVCPPPQTDQRGILRPQDGDEDGSALCDIGAFELGGDPSAP